MNILVSGIWCLNKHFTSHLVLYIPCRAVVSGTK